MLGSDNKENKTPFKVYKPSPGILLSAEKSDLVDPSTPSTPLKGQKTKLVKLPSTLSSSTRDDTCEDQPSRSFRIIPSAFFADLPVDQRNPEQWLATNLEVVKHVGTGNFSKVYQVLLKETSWSFALKKISKTHGHSVNLARREIINLWKVKGCKNCLQICLGWEDSNFINILTDYHPLSLGAISAVLSTQQRLLVLRDVLTGLVELHSRNLVHKDLKPDNILISSDGKALIGDFGVALDTLDPFALDSEIDGDARYLDLVETDDAHSRDTYSFGLLAKELLADSPHLEHLIQTLNLCLSTDIKIRPKLDSVIKSFDAAMDTLKYNPP